MGIGHIANKIGYLLAASIAIIIIISIVAMYLARSTYWDSTSAHMLHIKT